MSVRLALVPIGDLRMHELPEPDRVGRVVKSLQAAGVVKKAIAVDQKTMVVLDGVHRLLALQRLGCKRVPVTLIDYSTAEIVVRAKGGKATVPKGGVIEAALTGHKLPPKSTRHMVRQKDGTFVHISKIELDVEFPLAVLREPGPSKHKLLGGGPAPNSV